MTVKDILHDWLIEHGFDGLFADNECACLAEALMPCDSLGDCQPGYRAQCDPVTEDEACEACADGGWHIQAKKPEGRP